MTPKGIRIISVKRLKLAALFVFGLSILFYFFFDFCKHAPALGAANPFAEDPFDAVGSFGIQLALLSALLTLIRAFRPYPQKEAAPGQILLTLRAGTVVLLSVTVTLAADAIGLAHSIVTGGASLVAWALAALVTGMALVTLAASWTFVRVARSEMVPLAVSPRTCILVAQTETRFLHETGFLYCYALIIVNNILNFFSAFTACG